MIINIINLAIAFSPGRSGPGDNFFGAVIISFVCAVGAIYGFWMITNPKRYWEKRQEKLEKLAFDHINPFRARKRLQAQLELCAHLNTTSPRREVRLTACYFIVVCVIGEFAIWKFFLYNALFK